MKILKNVEILKKIYDKLLSDVAKQNNLTLNQLKILMFLENNCENNIAKNIVDGLGTTKSHVSMSVCDLEEKGYIEKIQDEKDKKKSHLKLTKKSFEVIDNGKKVQNKIKEIMLNGIEEKEIEALNSVAKKIQENLENYNNFGG